MFSKASKRDKASTKEAEAVALVDQLNEDWSKDPAIVIAHFLSSCNDPVAMIARVVVFLLHAKRISGDDLRVLGLDEAELESVVAAVINAENEEHMSYNLQVHSAMREYEAQIDDILSTNNAVLDAEQRANFRTTLAGFASENNLTDLKIAFRLMRAEGNDPLKATIQRGAVGYL